MNLFPTYEDAAFMAPEGCKQCNNTGYKGRVAIHELLLGTQSLKNAIKQRTNGDALKQLAIDEGMLTLKMDGILKVLQGKTNMEQILKVCI